MLLKIIRNGNVTQYKNKDDKLYGLYYNYFSKDETRIGYYFNYGFNGMMKRFIKNKNTTRMYEVKGIFTGAYSYDPKIYEYSLNKSNHGPGLDKYKGTKIVYWFSGKIRK